MNLQQLLQQLSEIAPEVCRLNLGVYDLGNYKFWIDDDRLQAIYSNIYVSGPPALAWLRDAIEQAIEARGWHYETSFWVYDGRPGYRVYIQSTKTRAVENTRATALLAAFVAALGGGQ